LLEAVKNRLGFVDIPLPSNASLYPSPDQWASWLTGNGPLWVTTIGAPSHAIIVRCITSDLTPAGTQMLINNPWDTSTTFTDDPIDFSPANARIAYQQSFADLASDFGNLAPSDYSSWCVLYLPSP
jgi:Papain-like cysteine protease AvrRpt2